MCNIMEDGGYTCRLKVVAYLIAVQSHSDLQI